MLFVLPISHFLSYRCSSNYGFACMCTNFFFFSLLFSFPPPLWSCTKPERDSLRSFLLDLSYDPGAFSSWKAEGNLDCCQWDGISCNENGSVTRIWLPHRGMKGHISPSLANLSQLMELNLSHNSLSGSLPTGLLLSDSIVDVDVSYNGFSGKLLLDTRSTARHDLQLRTLNVSSNFLNGSFPPIWEFAPELVVVNVSNNSFSGAITSPLCAVSSHLHTLDLSVNEFSGSIPQGLGNCFELREIRAGVNNFSGPLPRDLYDAVSLQKLSLRFNQLIGALDPDNIERLTELKLLDLGSNRLRGNLPESIGKLTNLEELLLEDNLLSGTLPQSLAKCTRLKSLNLRENKFTGEISAVNFSTLFNLATLDLGNNNLSGDLPSSVYSCKSLVALRLAKNSLKGVIAPEIANLKALSYLSLSNNNLHNVTGAFDVLRNCTSLTAIILSKNFNGERIPEALGGGDDAFQRLRALGLANCNLTGKIPSWVASLGNLEVLDLSLNNLTGSVPGELGSLPHLFYLDLSYNHLSGYLPLELMKLRTLTSEKAAAEVNRTSLELPVFVNFVSTPSLQYNQLSSLPPAIYLRNNSLRGDIPREIGLLKMLHALDLRSNNFSGRIPVQLSNLTNLEMLELSNNHLSGTIPPELSRLNFLSLLNVSYNDLCGPIPTQGQFQTFPNTSYEGNRGLCGPPLQITCNKEPEVQVKTKPRQKHILVGFALGMCLGGSFALILLIAYITTKIMKKNSRGETAERGEVYAISSSSISNLPQDNIDSKGSVVLFPDNCKSNNLTMFDIMKATNDFSQEHIIGCGGFGLVYKAILPDGTKLAIKKLSGEMGLMEREFKAEVEALSTASHKNLVSLQGYSICGSFRLLMYSYMENGSLDYWLHERADGGSILVWPIRLRIAQGTSQGLAYIHQTCQPHIVHRDIKSSNILLDHKFEAYVADFGLSRIMLSTDTHVTTELVGTLGYIPPEYGHAWMATLRGDIYSFGVVMLELLTGRRPIEVCDPKQSVEIVPWVEQMRSQGKQEEVFDQVLRGKGFEEQMLQVLDVACLCVNSDPLKRPTIKEVKDWLDIVGTTCK